MGKGVEEEGWRTPRIAMVLSSIFCGWFVVIGVNEGGG